MTQYHKVAQAEWKEIGGKKIYFRSKAEYRYALWLQYQKDYNMIDDWEHEPKTFWFENIKRGCRSYLPDFRVHPKFTSLTKDPYWVEVKGYYDAKSLTKIKRFRKYYPNEKLILIDSKWFSANAKKLKLILHNWE